LVYASKEQMLYPVKIKATCVKTARKRHDAMSGILTNSTQSASPLSSYAYSSTGSQSTSGTLSASYSPDYSPTVSGSPGAPISPAPIPIYSASPITSPFPNPTFRATPSSLAPLAPAQDNVTFSRQELIYIGVPIAVVIVFILSCAYNAHRDKKRLNKLLTQYKGAPSVVKVNPIMYNNSMV